jgi:predicted transcriptional regulator
MLKAMEVHFAPDVEKKLNDLAAQSGRGTDEVLQDALAGYFDDLVETRDMLNTRYDDLKSGTVKPIDGEEAFARLKAKTEAQRNRSE